MKGTREESSREGRFNLRLDGLLCLFGALLVAGLIPWADVFSLSTPSGGDNPAHPVLMQSLREAVLHGSIVHYSTKFWGGFELFQFYFPLPYLVGVFLSFILPWQIAYKLVTVFGVVALPPAFYWMCRGFGWSRATGFFGSLLSLGFLFTEAHKMWGGNMSSNLAGMFGNAWGFVFVLFALGAIAEAWRENVFSKRVVVWSLLAMTSHFYMLFLLLLFYGALFLVDLVRTVSGKAAADKAAFRAAGLGYFRFYLHPLLTLGLMSWWLLPLVYYREFSANFGVNWPIKLLETYTETERYAFAISFVVLTGVAFWRRKSEPILSALVLLVLVLAGAFTFNRFVPDTAFINVRLWPLLYFVFYLTTIAAWESCFGKRQPGVQLAGLLFLLPFVPSESSLTAAHEWMRWNYRGVEVTPAYAEFRQVVDFLNAQPAGRVTFESSPKNNWILGSVRVFEMLPLLTHHEIVEGGLVNSAPYAGVPYSLQCLVSSSCAGWPNGVLVPAKDVRRGIDLMKALGVRYHIAATGENSKALVETGEVDTLFQGKELTLIALKSPPSMVEVYDGAIPVFPERDRKFLAVNLYRYDSLRHSLALFDNRRDIFPGEQLVHPSTLSLFNDLTARWRSGERVLDASAWGRPKENKNFLNSYFFTLGKFLDPTEVFSSDSVNVYVSDRSFAPEVLFSDQQGLTTEMLLPLVREEVGEAKVFVMADGFRAFDGEKEIPTGADYPLRFEKSSVNGAVAPFAMLRFSWAPTDKYRFVDVLSEDRTVSPGFPAAGAVSGASHTQIPVPTRITDSCSPSLKSDFHRLTLTTNCPGKMHMLKYGYYPKWHVVAGGPDRISMATHGFMAFTPNASTAELTHRRGAADWIALVLTALTGSVLLIAWIRSPSER